MLAKKRHPVIFTVNILLFFAVILFGGNSIIDISIKNATPLLLLPMLTAFSIFNSVKSSAAAGFISGALLDSTSSGTYCFNTIFLMVLSVSVSLAANNLFNKNIRAAAALSLITSFIYYIIYWLIFMTFGVEIQNSLIYLLKYVLPSAVYSAVFIFPFYFLYKCFSKIKGTN